VDTPQDQGALGLRRQGGDRLGQAPQGVSIRGDTLRRRCILGQVALLKLFQSLERHDPRPSNMGRHERSRGLEQVGLGVTDVVHTIPHRQKAVGLLDHIVRVETVHSATQQPGAQSRFMRQDLPQQPARPPFIKVVRHLRALPPKRLLLKAKVDGRITSP
jgi:hypothetical protein